MREELRREQVHIMAFRPSEKLKPIKDTGIAYAAGLGYRIWVCPTFENAVAFTRKLQRRGGGTILNILGEHHATMDLVEKDFARYMELLDNVVAEKAKRKFNAVISIKPSQFGLHVHGMDPEAREAFTRKKMWDYVHAATSRGVRIEMDVETSRDHDFTYDLYKDFARRLHETGRSGMFAVAVQANYEKACERLKGLMRLDKNVYGNTKFRLVQGIYTPEKGDSNAISDPKKMVEYYKRLVKTGLGNKQTHHTIALGTHREDIAENLLDGADELQMLAGIRAPMRLGLQKQGVECWVYTPIGTREEAGPYASRRLSKATGLLLKSATDFVRPTIWTGSWYAKKKKEKEAERKKKGK